MVIIIDLISHSDEVMVREQKKMWRGEQGKNPTDKNGPGEELIEIISLFLRSFHRAMTRLRKWW